MFVVTGVSCAVIKPLHAMCVEVSRIPKHAFSYVQWVEFYLALWRANPDGSSHSFILLGTGDMLRLFSFLFHSKSLI